MKYSFLRFLFVLVCSALLLSCSPPTPADISTPTPTSEAPAAPTERPPVRTAFPTAAPTSTLPAPTPAAPATPEPGWKVCSPFPGAGIEQLADMIVNAYHPPPLGSDEPHQGVDLAFLAPGKVALAGESIQAVLGGQVAAVVDNRFPYGNALLVETRLEELISAPEQVQALSLAPPPIHRAPLYCPAPEVEAAWDTTQLSLYLLYAHLKQPPTLRLGDSLDCGQPVGSIGDSGNALSPHLHLELRIGPSGAVFSSMAHYDPSASLSEMTAYCDWRTSGFFQPVDPFILFSTP